MIRKYWCDPDNGQSSGFIQKIEDTEAIDSVEITLVGQEDSFSVYSQEIIDVLVSMEGIALDWIIDHPEFDKDYYIHHIGGATFDYRGFAISVFGEQSTFLNDERFYRSPALLLEFEDQLTFGDSSWIEIVEYEDFDVDYDVCGSFKEAKEAIDKMLSERSEPAKHKVRLEFKVVTYEFCEVEVEANSRGDAIYKAIREYENESEKYDMWAGDSVDITMCVSETEEWVVDKVEEPKTQK